jgi:hypothetical protein
MNGSKWWVVVALAATGCNCDPSSEPDASMPQLLSWPEGARLEITATTASTADLKWPDAIGPVATYRLTWPGDTKDEPGTTTTFTSLTPGQHLPVEVIAVQRSMALVPSPVGQAPSPRPAFHWARAMANSGATRLRAATHLFRFPGI